MTRVSGEITALALGQSYEPSGMVVLRRHEDLGEFDRKHKKWEIKVSYEVARVERWPRTVLGAIIPAIEGGTLLADVTTAGRPALVAMREAGLKPTPIRLDDSAAPRATGRALQVPKRDLVGTLGLLTEQRRWKASRSLQHADLLQRQIVAFRTDGGEDELVRALALACWYGERMARNTLKPPRPPLVIDPPKPPTFREAMKQNAREKAERRRSRI